jgi:hypothetical protein
MISGYICQNRTLWCASAIYRLLPDRSPWHHRSTENLGRLQHFKNAGRHSRPKSEVAISGPNASTAATTAIVYSDDTTVSQNQNQKAAFVAARYIYKF